AALLERHRHLRRDRARVELGDLVARPRSRVLHAHRHLYTLARAHGSLSDPQVRVLEARVGEAVAKRVERLPLEVAVCPSLHVVVGEGWELADGFVEGDRKAAR